MSSTLKEESAETQEYWLHAVRYQGLPLNKCPERFRTVELCKLAVKGRAEKNGYQILEFVPDAIRDEVRDYMLATTPQRPSATPW
jgi:hypothetical protein